MPFLLLAVFLDVFHDTFGIGRFVLGRFVRSFFIRRFVIGRFVTDRFLPFLPSQELLDGEREPAQQATLQRVSQLCRCRGRFSHLTDCSLNLECIGEVHFSSGWFQWFLDDYYIIHRNT